MTFDEDLDKRIAAKIADLSRSKEMRKLFTPAGKESLSVDMALAGRIDKLARAAKDIEKVDTLVNDVDQMELTLAQTFKLWKVILLLEQAYTNALEYVGKPTKENGKLNIARRPLTP